jgi:hypothetical protein
MLVPPIVPGWVGTSKWSSGFWIAQPDSSMCQVRAQIGSNALDKRDANGPPQLISEIKRFFFEEGRRSRCREAHCVS